MDLRTRVIEYVRTQPDKKAREIADALEADHREINSLLYRERGRTFEQIPGYRWRLRESKEPRTGAGRASAPQDTPLARLCRYYLACLSKDIECDPSEFATNKYGQPNYAELSVLPMIAADADEVWRAPEVQRILGKFRQEFRKLSLFVGYPTRLVRQQAKSGWEGFMVEPVLMFEHRLEGGRGTPELVEERPEINMRVVRALRGPTGVQGPDLLDEARQLREDLQLDTPGFGVDDLNDVCSALQKLHTEWDWREPLDAETLSSSPPLSEISEEGVYNRAVLLAAERPLYTQGLETELRKLESLTESQYLSTAIGDWLSDASLGASSVPVDEPLLEVLPLNTEQREAVRRSMTRPLTVITGPPGTGKSQVVTSLLVNCAWRGVRVLFASKNHKAVDVVETRVNAIGPRPILLRLGPRQTQSQLAEYLASLLAATVEAHERAEYEQAQSEHRDMLERRANLQKELDRIIEVRNQVDALEQSVEQFRQNLGSEWFDRVRNLDLAKYAQPVRTADAAVARATHDHLGLFGRLFWPFLRRGRIRNAHLAVGGLADVAEAMAIAPPPEPHEAVDLQQLRSYLRAVQDRLSAAREVGTYFDALKQLSECDSTESIAARSMDLDRELLGVCEELWELWLRLQPARLTTQERRLLADYKAVLESLNRAGESNRRSDRFLYRRVCELFLRLTSVLPAWAVTNLSARGRIPLQAGIFDLLVVDEASQCDIASVVPLLYRCKRAVILGDPKQLRHITKVPRYVDSELMEQHEISDFGERWSYPANSLFDVATCLTESGDVISLRDHHRSRAEIIGFSNGQFYEGRLRVATRYDVLRIPPDEPALRWVNVRGDVRRPSNGGAVNALEAKAVVQEIERLLVHQRYDGTIGVVTPFRAQANRIRELVHQNDRVLAALGQSELLIETAYRYQGDERDVMIFSPVVSADTPRTALGFLRGNPNTFNVAITRARAALIVAGDHAACRQCGVEHLAAFAQYVENFEPTVEDTMPAERDIGPRYPSVAHPERVSDWERFYYERLYEAGIRAVPQYGVEQYVLDLALFSGQRRLDIEIDGERYHRAWNGELALRDQIRNRRLIELGWDIMRFWVYQIRDNTEQCVSRVCRWCEDATREATAAVAPATRQRAQRTVLLEDVE